MNGTPLRLERESNIGSGHKFANPFVLAPNHLRPVQKEICGDMVNDVLLVNTGEYALTEKKHRISTDMKSNSECIERATSYHQATGFFGLPFFSLEAFEATSI